MISFDALVRLRWCALLLVGACGDASARGSGPVVHAFGGATMGSTYEVKFVGDVPLERVRAVVEAELAAFDATFSNWRDDSEIVRINRADGTAPLPVSARFAAVLRQALAVAAATDGAFDPTVKPMVDVYRALKRDPKKGIDAAAMAAAHARVGFRAIELRGDALIRARPDVELDLDGIVAGACADAIAAQLTELGVPAFYLQITGEVLCRGEKAPGLPWRIGVVDPAADVTGSDVPARTLPLRDRALCTSGDYRNAVVVDGKVLHHVLDPRTGRNPDHDVVSASVLAPSCAIADAVGTAVMVLGYDGVRRLWPRLRELGAEGALLLLPGDEPGSWRQLELDWPAEDS